MSNAVRIERVIPASPERVYRAWLDPSTLAQWSAPVGWSVARHEVDERVGGHYRCWHVDAEGREMGGYEAEILELAPNERIVLRWFFVGPDRVVDEGTESRLIVLLAPAADGGTALTLVHENLDGLADASPYIAENVQGGWSGTLDRLAGALA
jgi:uncharacterized protein YndB with AHSA1/START domain